MNLSFIPESGTMDATQSLIFWGAVGLAIIILIATPIIGILVWRSKRMKFTLKDGKFAKTEDAPQQSVRAPSGAQGAMVPPREYEEAPEPAQNVMQGAVYRQPRPVQPQPQYVPQQLPPIQRHVPQPQPVPISNTQMVAVVVHLSNGDAIPIATTVDDVQSLVNNLNQAILQKAILPIDKYFINGDKVEFYEVESTNG